MRLLKRILYWLMLAALTAGVVAFAVHAERLARAHRHAQKIERISISMPDSILSTRIVSEEQIVGWIDGAGIGTVGCNAGEVDLDAVRREMESHRNIRYEYAHTSYRGVLHISVGQYSPSVRLLTDGHDSYVTGSGYVFGAPEGSAVYVPVISGCYRPPFPSGFEGEVSAVMTAQTEACMEAIHESDRELRRIRYGIDTLIRKRRETTRQQLRKGFGESDELYAMKKETFREGKEKCIAQLNDIIATRRVDEDEAVRTVRDRWNDLKKTQTRHSDFWNLLKFAEAVRADRFLNAEIVQIEADTTYDGAPQLVLVPRSGSHRIVFGRVEDIEGKLSRLRKFYNEGLRNLGWDTFSVIDLSFDGQVVCTMAEHADESRQQ